MIDVRIATMELAGGVKQYWTQIVRGNRVFDVRCYGQRFKNRAQYEHDELRHVLLGEDKPNLADPKYADSEPMEGKTDGS